MGKKGKKGGKKKGGKKGRKKSKKSLPEVTWNEALLAYQINIKEKAVEETKYEEKFLEDQKARLRDRNDRLKEERDLHMQSMFKSLRNQDKKSNDEEVYTKDQVTEMMISNWEVKRVEEEEVTALKSKMVELDLELSQQKKQLEYWQDYRDRGQHEHDKQIKLLEQELVDMQTTFDEMSGHLKSTLERTKADILKSTNEILERQKYIATEKAIAKLDKNSRREVVDSEWLQKEVEVHRQDTDELLKEVEALEEENLNILSELFECHIDDRLIPRNTFLTQVADDDDLCKNSLLQIDLNQLKFSDSSLALAEKKVTQMNRPKSAIQQAVEAKLLAVDDRLVSESEEEDEQLLPEALGSSESTEEEMNIFPIDDDLDNYLELGKLEHRLMCVSGAGMNIHKAATPSLDEVIAQQYSPDEWPITAAMLNEVIKRPVTQSPRLSASTVE